MPPLKPYYRVLVTGYGKFSTYEENPSWLAVKPLNGTIIHRNPHTQSDINGDYQRPIHITSFEIPVAYSSVLSVVPPLHSRPPLLPENVEDSGLPPPVDGYDLILHAGVGSRGGLSIEKRGRKSGYQIPDVLKELAPEISSPDDALEIVHPISESQLREINRVDDDTRKSISENQTTQSEKMVGQVKRGFAAGYEGFREELWNSLDIEGLVKHLKVEGFESVKSSDDAGLYLCEFINYCALAESTRPQASSEPGKRSNVLFVHVPPIGEDLSTEITTEGIKLVIKSICWGLHQPTGAQR